MSSNDRIWSCAFSFDRCARITHLRYSSVKYCRFVFRIPRQSLVVVVQGLLKEKKIVCQYWAYFERLLVCTTWSMTYGQKHNTRSVSMETSDVTQERKRVRQGYEW